MESAACNIFMKTYCKENFDISHNSKGVKFLYFCIECVGCRMSSLNPECFENKNIAFKLLRATLLSVLSFRAEVIFASGCWQLTNETSCTFLVVSGLF